MRQSHILWNFGGLALPLAIAFLAIPHLLTTLGPEKFGLLALAWGLIGYASALDLGIGRALTQMIGVFRGQGKEAQVATALNTANRMTLVVGLTGGLLLVLAALLGGYRWIKVTTTSADELFYSMLLLAVALPAQAMSATFRGVNEAFLNFKGISLVRVTLGVVNFGGPWLVSVYSLSLPASVATLVISRLLALVVYRQLAFNCIGLGGELTPGRYAPEIAKALFSFGKWVTVSSIVSPVLVQADRFVIAAMLSAAAVSIYVIPYEMVTQCLIIAGSISSVIFPYLSKLITEGAGEWKLYFNKWNIRVAALMAVTSVSFAVLLPYLLPWWIKAEFDDQSVLIGQILCLGIFLNAVGTMYYAAIHAGGRADITAKIHLVELPLYLLTLVILLKVYGVAGAACAWTLRMAIDALLLRQSFKKL